MAKLSANDQELRVSLERLFEHVLPGPREVSLDGTIHKQGDCCRERECPVCGDTQHFQGIYAGYMLACHTCDVENFKIAGTYDDETGREVMW